MKKFNFKRIIALALGLTLMVSTLIPGVSAANEAEAIINPSQDTSLTLYKYDMTGAEQDGVWTTESYISTGIQDDTVNSTLSKYAIEGVEFSYLKVADISIYKGKDANGRQEVVPLYGFAEDTEAFLSILGLTAEDAYRKDNSIYYFESDTLIRALSDSLSSNSTVTKTALEQYMALSGGTAMPETDVNGKSAVEHMNQGLYLLVETRVPENVTSTTDPSLVSLPMTTIDGESWNYDVTVYPKNETGAPNLEKTVREAKNDTGKNNGSTNDITDGYAHTATASDGDVVDYQIISTLPTITSPATALTTYTFVDTMSKGIQYNKGDVQIEFFKDAQCTILVATWTEADGKFSPIYTDYNSATGSSMTIEMTAEGLKEINSAATVYDTAVGLRRGYSNLTMRITYSCTVNSDATVVYGDNGNPNEVVLTWKRTNTDYYDTLKDDCHVYTYGIDLTKKFSDNASNFANVSFLVHNTTDGYYVQAEQKDGIYYVTGHTVKESEATQFVPTDKGKVIVKGLEDDTYVITETKTDKGYALLKENITVVISTKESGKTCEVCGKALLTATATVNGKDVQMDADNGSVSAIVPLKVVNTVAFDLPKTGGTGNKLLYALGALAMLSAMGSAIALMRKCRKA